MLPQTKLPEAQQNGAGGKERDEEQIPEIWSYLGVLVQVRWNTVEKKDKRY